MRIYTYTWLHLLTGKTGQKDLECSSFKKFLEQVNEWNRMGEKLWKYWY